MMVNTSSFSDNSSLQSVFPNLGYSIYIHCALSRPSSQIFTTFHITNTLLLLPLCTFILYHGLWQCQGKRTTSSPAAMTHSDCFTYHLVAIELIGVIGSIIFCCGVFSHHRAVMAVGGLVFSFNWYGQIFFHILTCVERYLAVVHPITYRSLRSERWIIIRNILTGCVWLYCFFSVGLILREGSFVIMDSILLVASLVVISFCSLSVLRVLIDPGPGEQGGARDKVDQVKRRAFYTIVAILAVLFLRFACNLFWVLGFLFEQDNTCIVMVSCAWINLPNSLMLPMLFLRREGKLKC